LARKRLDDRDREEDPDNESQRRKLCVEVKQ
jgi:hypothetical protein